MHITVKEISLKRQLYGILEKAKLWTQKKISVVRDRGEVVLNSGAQNF